MVNVDLNLDKVLSLSDKMPDKEFEELLNKFDKKDFVEYFLESNKLDNDEGVDEDEYIP